MQQLIDRFVDVVTAKNRPFRILLFGGVFLGLLIMNILARLFGVKTNIGGDIDLANAVLIVISLLAGFGISYSVVHFADASKRKRTQR
ncbi:MAG: hypothetical protein OXC41_06425 [Gammaproteobacteria bacterium]|nr:hypothetical protein [Gammaproteobacteria bacterium]